MPQILAQAGRAQPRILLETLPSHVAQPGKHTTAQVGRQIAIQQRFGQIEIAFGHQFIDPGEQIFIDLGPHPLSVLMGFCGPGAMDEASAACTVEQKVVEARFDYVRAGGGVCHVHIVCRNRPEGDLVRRFGINDLLVDYEGRNDDEGVYRAYLSRDGAELCAQDFVEASIERFVAAVRGDRERPLATAAEGLHNLHMQLRLLALAERR